MSIWNFWDHWNYRNFVWLVIAIILIDYLLLPKVEHLQEASLNVLVEDYTHRGRKTENCVIAINIPSKWGNKVYESRRVRKSLCESTKESEPVKIIHTAFLKRWVFYRNNESNYYLPEKRIIFDALLVILSTGFYIHIKKRKPRLREVLTMNSILFVLIAFIMYTPVTSLI